MKGSKINQLPASKPPRSPAVIPAAVIAAGLLSADAWSAPGDFDPAFGTVGRVNRLLNLVGPAWSVEAEEDGYQIGGGEDELLCDYYSYCEGVNFSAHLSDDGSFGQDDRGAPVTNVGGYDLALQPDGKSVVVGNSSVNNIRSMVVYRLQEDRTLDSAFGVGGIVKISDPGDTGVLNGHSVVLDSGGRIVIAGRRGDGKPAVARLLANGARDGAFGTDGLLVLDRPDITSPVRPQIVRAPGGGYRINALRKDVGGCIILALTDTGEMDHRFGAEGLTTREAAAGLTDCTAIALDANGRLLLGGGSNSGVVVRLLADGTLDASFAATPVADAMGSVTALAATANGSVFVAGPARNPSDSAIVTRLQADGTVDGSFGNQGYTPIELDSEWSMPSTVLDMKVLPDSGLIMAGSYRTWVSGSALPFVVRLLGDQSSDGPGAIGMKTANFNAFERDGQAIITVRRFGGSKGAVSVAIEARADPRVTSAAAGPDFTAVQSQLTWADGDTSDRQFTVPIGTDADESREQFLVTLSGAQGDTGFGTRNAVVTIQGAGYPSGLIRFGQGPIVVLESAGVAQIEVRRDDYASGAISVTATPVGGTATPGADFTRDPIIVSWGDGETRSKLIRIPIVADTQNESEETFSVTLSAASGGAVIGTQSTVAISLRDRLATGSGGGGNSNGSGGGGGGRLDLWAALLLGLGGLLRRWRHIS